MQIRLFTAVSTFAVLTACGGGGGGSATNSTPPPPQNNPSSPAVNADLLGPSLLSENFTNDAATGNAIYPKNGDAPTLSAAQSVASVNYDASTQKYTLAVGGRSQAFLPSDLSAAQSSSAISVYVKNSGSTADTLTLTKAGTSGRFNYRYVAGGFWQRTVDGGSTLSGNLDAISFGVETVSTGVPRSGYAAYDVDLIGAETLPDNVVGITGQGKLLVDFTAGQIVTTGQIDNLMGFGAAKFRGDAKMSSVEGTFAGTMGLTSASNSYSGLLNGRFFGPTADEVGAAFSARAGNGNAVVGALVGRQAAVPGGNSAITNLNVAEFLKGDSARLTFTGSKTIPVAIQSKSAGGIAVYYDPARGTYDLLLGDRSAQLTNASFTSFQELLFYEFAAMAASRTYAGYQSPLSSSSAPTLQYLRAGRSYTTDGLRYRFDDVIFGAATPGDNLPRTGQAGYDIMLTGSVAQPGMTAVRTITGIGTILADFTTSSLAAQGNLVDYFYSGYHPTNIGTFSGTANIAGSENNFSGSLSFSGFGNYNGALRGRFYGPVANEVGAVFSLDGPDGSMASGALYGAQNPAIMTSRTPLAQLSASTDLFGVAGQSYIEPLDGRLKNFVDGNIQITYDPVSASYTFKTQNGWRTDGSTPLAITLTAQEKVVAGSDASYTIYQKAAVDGRLLNSGLGNPTIALTYTSFADIIATVDRNGAAITTRYYVPFGVITALNEMPRQGVGNYTGILVGHGKQRGFSNDVILSGTSAMTIDFATRSGTASLAMNATDRISGAQMSIGTFDFLGGNGTITRDGHNKFSYYATGFSNLPAGGNVSGSFAGAFYGPSAAEFGGGFSLTVSDGSGQAANDSQFVGVAVGKR